MNKSNSSQPDAGAGDTPVSRKVFLGAAIGGAGLCYVGLMAYPVYRYLASPLDKAASMATVTEVTVEDALKLEPGTAKMFKFGSRPALLIRHEDGTWTALDAVCTHLGCTVQYEAEEKRIYCACHGGVYDARTGGNISGPPPKPLPSFVVKVTDKSVVVSRA